MGNTYGIISKPDQLPKDNPEIERFNETLDYLTPIEYIENEKDYLEII